MFESIFRALTRYSLIWWAGASVLLLVSACTTVPVERATPSVSQQPAAKTGERPAAGGLSNELVYEFLLGDVAARRDDISTAARSMAKAALWSEVLVNECWRNGPRDYLYRCLEQNCLWCRYF